MNQHIEKARKANRAADAIAGSMAQTLLEMRPTFAHQFNIDEQLVTLAIAQAAVGVAASATSKATGMVAALRRFCSYTSWKMPISTALHN